MPTVAACSKRWRSLPDIVAIPLVCSRPWRTGTLCTTDLVGTCLAFGAE